MVCFFSSQKHKYILKIRRVLIQQKLLMYISYFADSIRQLFKYQIMFFNMISHVNYKQRSPGV